LARREALGKGVGALFSDQVEQETEVKSPELSVITKESGVITNKSEVGSNECEVKTPESLVITNKSEVISKDSGVITNKLEVGSNECEVKTPESLVITNESEAISKDSGVITNKSEVGSNEFEVKTQEPLVTNNELEVISKDSGVITNKSEVGSNEFEVKTQEPLVITNESEVMTSGEKKKDQQQRSGKRGQKRMRRASAMKTKQITEATGHPRVKTVDQEILEQAIGEGLESPRISTWSPLVMSTLRYLQLTTARFSMSKEVSQTLEAAFREKYPELFERIEKELEER